ncbi:MAG: hypothetical protein V2A58_17480 [Planctomycetota bacterium]
MRTLVALTLVTVFLLCGGVSPGCRQVKTTPARLHPVAMDVRVLRFPPENFGRIAAVWAYADEGKLPPATREAWKGAGLRIGKVSRLHAARVEEILREAGTETIPAGLVGIPSSTVVPIEAGARIVVPAGGVGPQDTGVESILAFRTSPRMRQTTGLGFEIAPVIVRADNKKELLSRRDLDVLVSCENGDSILIGPASDQPEGLSAYLRSVQQKGWLQAFWIRVPAAPTNP